jgi:hypothetical protein
MIVLLGGWRIVLHFNLCDYGIENTSCEKTDTSVAVKEGTFQKGVFEDLAQHLW